MTVQQPEVKPQWWQTLLKGDYLSKRPRRGDICEATILSIGEHDIIVELAGKRDGLIQREDLAEVDESYLSELEIGEHIPVCVLRVPYDRSAIFVSLKQGLKQQEWMRVKALQESQEIIEVEVLEVNRGGLIAAVGGLQGFVPNSHLIAVPRGMRGKKRQAEKIALIGETLGVVVLEVQSSRRRLVLSERVAQRQRRKALLEELHEGAIRTGTVRNLTSYGAFIDLGGIDGLLHISELSWEFVENPCDVLNLGDEVEVYVLDVDRERERISLSRKHLLPPELVENL